ncbi:MAG TPA: GGDEF domain-containing protein [Verrucomicrobiae bacterium]|nr:GGDEF domain-containing protein [Verrucomicrobiae bacterium]
MARWRMVVIAAGLLYLAHIAVVALWGTAGYGPVLSDGIQLALGGLLIYVTVEATNRSEGLARSFWRLTTIAYILWFLAQGLSVYNDFANGAELAWIINLLFCFWFVPLAMAIFLDPEQKSGRLDTLMVLDFIQAVLVCITAYLYFFYLPKAESPGELAHSVWTPYFVGYALVAGALLLRAVATHSRDAKALFGRMGGAIALSGCVDGLYYYGPGRTLRTGAWFDLLWSALILVPMAIAITWRQAEAPEIAPEEPIRGKRIYTEIFYLLYPLLVLFMCVRIAREQLELAAVVVLLSFLCSSTRQLITQNRLAEAQETLRREAARDSLTSLWNRKAILGILERELVRAERDRQPVGLIMVDVDHFKVINDTRGHAAGDAVLRIIASAIAAVVRPYDSVGRYGGEEFLIVAPGCGLAEAWDLAERVRSHVAGCNIMTAGASIKVSLSLGIANGDSAAGIEKLLQAADTALYQAKNAGRNQVAPALGRAAAASQNAVQSDFWL